MTGYQGEALVAAFRPGLKRLASKYGGKSRAVYAVKFILASRLLHTIAETNSSSRDWVETRILVEQLVEGLSEHFSEIVSQPPQRDPHFPMPFYANLRPNLGAYASRMYQHQLVRLNSDAAQRSIRSGVYLYCVTKNGDFVVLNQSMTVEHLLCGISIDGVRITHPMLLPDGDSSVQCAGEVALALTAGRLVAGIFSRGSGHYRPSSEGLSSVHQIAVTTLGMASENVLLVG